jgi:hypothetical protein
MLNVVFVENCLASYADQGLVVDSKNGEFAHFPEPECLGGVKGVYLLHGDHQRHGLLQSVDYNKCCFYPGNVKKWLDSFKEVLQDYEDLLSIYVKYTSMHGKSRAESIPLEDKRKGGINAVLRQVGIHDPANKQKVIDNNSRNGKKCKRDKLGIHAPENRLKVLESGAKARAQVWQSTVDGFIGNAGNVARHNRSIGADPSSRVRID